MWLAQWCHAASRLLKLCTCFSIVVCARLGQSVSERWARATDCRGLAAAAGLSLSTNQELGQGLFHVPDLRYMQHRKNLGRGLRSASRAGWAQSQFV